MQIPVPSQLHTGAKERLSAAPGFRQIVLIHTGLVLGLSAVSTLVSYLLGLAMDQSGGLGNIGTRSMLSTLSTLLPLVLSALVMCLDAGYLAAILRVTREQYVSPNTLRLGFDRFWVLLRAGILRGCILFAMGIASVYAGTAIFLLTPLSNSVVELLAPLVSQSSLLTPEVVIDDALYAQIMDHMGPAFAICGLIFCIAAVPVLYRYRMVSYIIIDKPGKGALAAMQESRKLMRGNCLRLLRVDLSLWWYYGASIAASVVCYGDVILPGLGIQLPFSADMSYFLFYGAYLVLLFGVYRWLRPHAEAVNALAYNAVKPVEKPQSGGVVLGNIFQM